eukprot:TRINITY_DN6722_c0_g1::TRINITY_DN6722_c0_g1_i1::g.3041::m.3041 TRINITY_DN6722_c0_g1::TRINITY_DN6722_c0_g1_i1::g.3041  ORF type:complete len:123 (+),score=-15.36,SRCR/PF00530.13/0.021,SRCR_2/PF15494.1/0.023 TRINITY_DN6722_c0_g1_i1:276-644(+)
MKSLNSASVKYRLDVGHLGFRFFGMRKCGNSKWVCLKHWQRQQAQVACPTIGHKYSENWDCGKTLGNIQRHYTHNHQHTAIILILADITSISRVAFYFLFGAFYRSRLHQFPRFCIHSSERE